MYKHSGPSLRDPPSSLLLLRKTIARPHPSHFWMARGRRRATSGLSLLVLVRAADASQTLLQTQTQTQNADGFYSPLQ